MKEYFDEPIEEWDEHDFDVDLMIEEIKTFENKNHLEE